jgi:tetratricopeptide (TPR) repeat protein
MDEAEAEYLEILKLEKDKPDPLTCYKLASIKEAKNSLEDAHHYYEIAARAPTATTDMHLSLARIDLAMKNAPDAQTELSKIGDPANQTAEFRLMQLDVYVQAGQFDSAATLANDYLAQHSNDSKALGLAAQAAGKQQRYEDQAGFLERLVGVSPDDKDARYRLVRLYIAHPELKKDDRTLELLSNFVSRKEVDPEGYLCLAYLYGRNKDAASAKTFYDLGFSYMPTPVPGKLAWAYTSYANFLEGQGNLDDALVSQMRAAEIDPSNERAQYNLGVIYLKRRQFEDAERVLGKLQAMNSDLAVKLEDDVRKTPHKVKTGAQ